MRSTGFIRLAFAAVLALLAAAAITASPAAAQGITTQMSEVQRNALKDGCWKVFKNDGYRRAQCLNGDRHWERALKEGCYQRYNGNSSKLSQCLDTGRLYASDPYRDDRYYGYKDRYGDRSVNVATDLNEVQRNALKDGCWRYFQHDGYRRTQCLNGERYWERALRAGCDQRYNGNSSKLNSCLDMSRFESNYGYGHRDGRGDRYGNRYDGNLTFLSNLQQKALAEGCQRRYYDTRRGYDACVRGETDWRGALEEGCHERYGNSSSKLRLCLDY